MVVSVQSTLCLLVYCKQNARQFWEYSLTRAPSWGWNFGRPNLPTDAYCILMMISWNIIIHQNNTNWGVHKIYCSLRSSLMLHIQLKQTVQNSPSQLSKPIVSQNYLHVPLVVATGMRYHNSKYHSMNHDDRDALISKSLKHKSSGHGQWMIVLFG